MEKIQHLIEMAKQSHHLPWALAFFVGLVITKKDRCNDVEILGDNVPTTLIEGLGR